MSQAVTNRIKYFLQIQSDEIEARLLGCAYKVPFKPIPPVIRTLCAELAYIAMYRVRHSTDSTAPDPFMYVTQRHHQIFADIHARRLRLGIEQHTLDVPMVVGDKTAAGRKQMATVTPTVPQKRKIVRNRK
jgi:phage gp36-like protein